MRTGTSELGMLDQLRTMQPDDFSLENPYVDPDQVVVTFPFAHAWFAPEWLSIVSGSLDIGAGAQAVTDTGMTQQIATARADSARLYRNLFVELFGGGTSPVTVRVTLVNAASMLSSLVTRRDVTNPGDMNVSSILAPPGWLLEVQVGAGTAATDTAFVNLQGEQARRGRPLAFPGSGTTVVQGV